MKNKSLITGLIGLVTIVTFGINLTSAEEPYNFSRKSFNFAPIQNIFMQGNNINTVFRTDGIMNYDWITFPDHDAGMIWPVTHPLRATINFASGIWVGAKVILPGNQKELRLGAAWYASHFTPGNIPVVGQVPPASVCADPKWRGYFVQLTDPSLVNGGTRYKVAGGRQFTFNYDPWSLWPVDLGAPYVEVNGIPGYQPGWSADRPGIGSSRARPDDLLYMVYMDYTNCTDSIHYSMGGMPGGTRPLGLEMHQLCFMFSCPMLQNMYFVKCKLINKSGKTWDSTYVSYFDDIDVGIGVPGARDDAVGCDTARNLGFIYNADNLDVTYGPNPPALGYSLLQSPLVYSGNNNDTAKLPYDTLVGYRLLGMTCFRNPIKTSPDSCTGEPSNAIAGYNFMKGLDGCGRVKYHPITHQPTMFSFSGDACNRIGWFDSLSRDVRMMMSSGPITMNSLDTQVIVLAAIVGRGTNNFQSVCEVQNFADSALKYYYNDFIACVPIGIQNLSSETPKDYRLYQNYPNPFNPVTRIKFSLPLPSEGRVYSVRLVIYNVQGKEAAILIPPLRSTTPQSRRLVEGGQEGLKPGTPACRSLGAGTYEVDWDATGYPSGVYFYSITAGEYKETKRMVLLK
jgi:hypothetical protein